MIKYQTKCDILHIKVYYKDKKKKIFQHKLLVLNLNDILYFATASETRKWFPLENCKSLLGIGLQAVHNLVALHSLPEPPAKSRKKWLKHLDDDIGISDVRSPLQSNENSENTSFGNFPLPYSLTSDYLNDAISDLSTRSRIYSNRRAVTAPDLWNSLSETPLNNSNGEIPSRVYPLQQRKYL
jgi:hypothetical protein